MRTIEISSLHLDDVLVYSKSFEYHANHLQQIIQQFTERGMKLKPSKCKFFQKQVKFLGHIVTAEGYKVDPSLTKSITKFLGDPPRLIKILSQTYSKLQFSCTTTL